MLKAWLSCNKSGMPFPLSSPDYLLLILWSFLSFPTSFHIPFCLPTSFHKLGSGDTLLCYPNVLSRPLSSQFTTPNLWLSTVCLYGSSSSYNWCLAKYLALALSLLSNYYLTQFTVCVSTFSDLSSLLLEDVCSLSQLQNVPQAELKSPSLLGANKTNVIFFCAWQLERHLKTLPDPPGAGPNILISF